MKIIRRDYFELSTSDKIEIDRFIAAHNGLIFHETDFNRIVAESFNTKLGYHMAYRKNVLVAVCPFHSLKCRWLTNSYSNPTQFEIPYGGWVFDKSLASFRELFFNMKLRCNESLKIVSSFFDGKDALNGDQSTLSTALINLESDECDILNGPISSNTRHNIRRASKKGVSVRLMEDCGRFLELYCTLKSDIGKNISAASKSFIKNIHEKYSGENKAFIMGAVHEGEIISAVLCIGNQNVFHAYIAGRIAELPKNIYQNELLWWNCILKAKEIPSRYFDLCVIEPERLPQIAQFKMGFSKEIIPFYHISRKSTTFRIINWIQNAFFL